MNNVKVLILWVSFISLVGADRSFCMSSPNKQNGGLSGDYEQRKESLLLQAEAILVFKEYFFRVFSRKEGYYRENGYSDDKQKNLLNSMALLRCLEESGLVVKGQKNVAVYERIMVEINMFRLMPSQRVLWDIEHAAVKAWFEKSFELIDIREQTLILWPKQLREDNPVAFIATVLNEFQGLCAEKKIRIEPIDFRDTSSFKTGRASHN